MITTQSGNSNTAERLDVAVARYQLENVASSILPAAGTALLLFLVLQNDSNRRTLLLWCAAALLAKLLAAIHARRALARPTQSLVVARITWTQAALYALQGALWGSLAWIAIRPDALVDSLIVLSVIAGLASGSVSYLASNPPAFVAFVMMEYLGVASRLLSFGDHSFNVLAAICFALPVILIAQARNSARATRESIAIRYENLDLMQQLREEGENTRKAYLAAQQANEAKLRFLAAASHDLRQPVHSLGLFLEALGRSPLSVEQADMLAKAQAVTDSSVSMLNALLDFSRIEAGAIKPGLKPVDLQALLNKMELEYAQQANDRQLVYRSRDTALVAYTDPLLLELMLRNLITNAIRYTQRGGILVACRHRGANMVLEVWDTGIGIPPENQIDIFQEFTQLHNPERDQRKGLGLGLAIARGFARLLNLQLSVSSVPGRGSVFRIVAPLSQDQPTQGNVAAETAPLPKGLRILIVDDDEFVRASTLATVAGWHCEAEVVESVEQAREAARRQRPDVLISDYRLRELRTGADVIASLREECGSDIPAVLITGDTAPERIREALRIGVPLLHKPVNSEALRQAVADVIVTTIR